MTVSMGMTVSFNIYGLFVTRTLTLFMALGCCYDPNNSNRPNNPNDSNNPNKSNNPNHHNHPSELDNPNDPNKFLQS